MRTALYNSPCVVGLGARLLPLLADGDVFAESPADLDFLDRDCSLILDNLAHVAESTGRDPEYIAYRVGNIRSAIISAREVGGCVVIW